MSELPDETIDEALRLTRLARRAEEENEAAAYRREREGLLSDVGFTARVRDDDGRDVLVLHPAEWVENGTARVDRIEDTSRAVEVPLEGPGNADRFDEVDAHNRDVVSAVADRAGADHAANVDAFADFMGNHYVKRVERATAREVREFLTEYYPRNVWPTDEQRAVVEASLRLAFEVADRDPPAPLRE